MVGPGMTTLPNFYPRSPCGERQLHVFLGDDGFNFYPRSPCGERLLSIFTLPPFVRISIHALLAESDFNCTVNK